MANKLAIVGAGGHAKVVLDAALLMNRWHDIVFLDDAAQGELLGYPILGNSHLLGTRLLPSEYDVVIAIGNNVIRAQHLQRAEQLGFALPTILHPTATLSRFAQLQQGSVVFAHAVVNASAQVGKGAIINTAATIDHDCILGDYVHISPAAHLGGNTRVGDYSWLGIGCSTRHGSTIGSHCLIGAGATVIQAIANHTTAIGTPAQPLQKD